MFDSDSTNTILLYLITAAGAVAAAIWLGLIIWTWRDMRQRSRDLLATVAATLLVAVLGIFGVIIYVMLRPPETLTEAYERSLEEEALLQNIEQKPVCPGCGRPTDAEWQVCPYCHTKLKKACIECQRLLELPWNLCPYCAAPQIGYDDGRAARVQPAPARAAPPAPYPPSEEAEAVEFVEDEGF